MKFSLHLFFVFFLYPLSPICVAQLLESRACSGECLTYSKLYYWRDVSDDNNSAANGEISCLPSLLYVRTLFVWRFSCPAHAVTIAVNACVPCCVWQTLPSYSDLPHLALTALSPTLPWRSLNPGLGMLYECPIYDWELQGSLISVCWLVGGLFANCHLTKYFSDLPSGMFWSLRITINS